MGIKQKYSVGTKFNKLTIIGYNHTTKKYICKCDCGGLTTASAYCLRIGRHKSCQCGNHNPRPNRRLSYDVAIKRRIYKNYKRAAKNRGYCFDLTEEQFFDIISQNCAYCGYPPMMEYHEKNNHHRYFVYNGVDRVNNSIGYTKENVVACCKICNNSKSTLSVDAWKTWILRVYHNFIDK